MLTLEVQVSLLLQIFSCEWVSGMDTRMVTRLFQAFQKICLSYQHRKGQLVIIQIAFIYLAENAMMSCSLKFGDDGN